MNYSIDDALFARWPTFIRRVVVASNVSNAPSNSGLDDEFRSLLRLVAEDATLDVNHPRITAWQRVYDSFPTSERVRPSIHTLMRRAKNPHGKPIPFISALVCISNLVSLKYLVPSGLVDASKIQGDVALGFAQGGERFMAIGADSVDAALPGEVIYYDTSTRDVLCRAWNSRGARVAATDSDTRNVIIDMDGLTGVISRENLREATEFLVTLLARFCGGSARVFELSVNTPALDVGDTF